jgi:beta-galactosidase
MKRTSGRRRFLKLSALTMAVATGGTLGTLSLQNAQAATPATTYTPPSSNRIDTIIDTGWKFNEGDVSNAQATTFNDSSWSSVTLPHTWNTIDAEKGGSYYRGISWYRLHYTVPASYANHQLFLQFDGACLVADVYVNGTYLGEHQGGFATFRFEATSTLVVGSENVIAVKVNNAASTDIPPLNGDFNYFGGLYRDVHLVGVDNVHLAMQDYASSGLFLRQTNVSASSANLQVTAETFNDNGTAQNVTLTTYIVDAASTIVQTLTATQSVAAHAGYTFVQNTTIANPHLWNGRSDPYLYTVYAQLQVNSSVNDLVSAPLGFRFYSIDPNNGFFLNGQHLDLHGVNVHQGHLDLGWATTNANIDQDFSLILAMGANVIRTCHYQHAPHFYDNADKNGIILWAEQPIINSIISTTAFTQSAEQQLTEMIRQNYNHPSIIFWSIANEPDDTSNINTLLQTLNGVAQTQDPNRPTTLADNHSAGGDIAQHTSTVGYNQYYGWYTGSYNNLAGFLSSAHTLNPKSFAMSEYGAGASIYQHQENPPQPVTTSYFHPEEYQALLHEASWQQLASEPYVWGKFIWSMFDFASSSRNEGDHAGRNDKGLCTYDRVTCKDAYYWYKANWTTTPFVYITSRRHINRTSPTTGVKIYANTSTVTLTVNGTSLGNVTSTSHIFQWSNVTLQSGNNTVEATSTQNGQTYIDTVIWNYNPDVRLIAGSRMPYTDSAGKFYDVDHYYTGGTTGSTTATIANTPDPAKFQTYRVGASFSYNLPVVNGTYTLYLDFVEPHWTASGQRVFSVSANGTTLLSNFDIYSQVGENTALQKQFTLTVTGGTVALNFTASVDNAIIGAISLVKTS